MDGTSGDKRWAAIMSSDMVGFTQTTQDLGQERAFALTQHALALAEKTVEAHGGRIVDTAGDGFLAAFGAPVALENATVMACRAALAFHRALDAEAEALRAEYGSVPSFRTGLSGGPIMVAHVNDARVKLIGDAVNEAARLEAEAPPGGIIASDTIVRESEGFVLTGDTGTLVLKGFANPVTWHRLEGLTDPATRFEGTAKRGLSGFVSRKPELDTALAALAGGRPVALSGVPGIGKSRLAYEITTALSDRKTIATGQCAPTDTAFALVFDLVRDAAGCPRDATRADIVAAATERFGSDLTGPLVAVLDSDGPKSDDKSRAIRTREALGALLTGIAGGFGIVFLVEDAHWLDSASSSVLAMLLDRGAPFIVTHRPTATAPWLSSPALCRIALAPLASADIETLVSMRLPGRISPALTQLIAEKSGGNPLVAEEITRALSLPGRLAASPDGLDLAGETASLLTGTLEQLILSRVDRLTAEDREAIETASAIGRDFSEDLLDAALGRASTLGQMADTDLIEPTGPRQWRFSHALVRDAVHGSLLTQRRQSAHKRIAGALEASTGSDGQDWARLAYHHDAAGNARDAVRAFIRAGQAALRDYDLPTADQTLGRAFAQLEHAPDLADEAQYRDLVLTWLRTLLQMGDFARLKNTARRALPRMEREGYSSALSITRTLTAIAMCQARDYAGAEALAQATLTDAEAAGDPGGAAWAKTALMRVFDETGWQTIETIERLAAEIRPVAEAIDDRHLAMTALYQLSSAYRSVGRKQEALAAAERILTFAKRYDDRRALAFAAWSKALIFGIEGDPERALDAVAEGRRNAIPGSGDESVCRTVELFSATFLAQPETVRDEVEASIAKYRHMGDHNLLHSMEWIGTVIEFRSGRLHAGWQRLNRLLTEVAPLGNVNVERQFRLLKAEVLLSAAGLIDPDSEAPPDRPKPHRERPEAADIITFLRIRPTALRHARTELQRCLELEREAGGAHFARAKIGLGLVALARRRRKVARDHLTAGHAAALAEGVPVLVARADRALAKLRP
ncbi:AAA family ATPase [Alphaproteobacteria bacterium GH1-50]|uniref:AAA family ATPase n=1 Tax=Kangsaoukella pontilimi TaxID=2691042 RepID=A0A7C9IKM6_9RHOB|nr:adenylate/guanylate cyclase domain-containing protein [Kangsaoukella pontilimi]MXQ09722.1 AAA family ATPase [Kangsaoukella pontilimi]